MTINSSTTETLSFRETLLHYKDKRLWIIFLLGFSSGFPWVIIGSAMSAWLQEAGLTRTAIGFFGSIFAVYAFNFLWAPLVDRVKLPMLTRLGQRRSWILLTQMTLFAGIIILSTIDPAKTIWLTSITALAIALASATQDIAIDAYRIDSIKQDEGYLIPSGSAMATSGWWTGYSLPGAFAFFYSDVAGTTWADVYLALSLIMAALMVATVFIREPKSDLEKTQADIEANYLQKISHSTRPHMLQKVLVWLIVTSVDPLVEFFRRNGVKLALAILVFIFLFKIGESFLGRMSIVFYKEVGFTNTEIGTYSKLVGWWVTIIFSILGSFVNSRLGILKGLLIGGLSMAASNLMFSWIAHVGPNTTLFGATILVDGFTGAFATVTFVSFITSLTSRTYTATQYALMASIGNMGRTIFASSSGVMVDWLHGNWSLFFIITALMVIPSLLLLLWIWKHLQQTMTDHKLLQ